MTGSIATAPIHRDFSYKKCRKICLQYCRKQKEAEVKLNFLSYIYH